MSSIPSNITRVPTLLMATAAGSTIARTNLSLFQVQAQLASGKAITRFSDDAAKAAAIAILDSRLERADQRLRNLQHADSALSTLDQALGDASDLVLEAKSIASAQVGTGATASERAAQAQVVESLIQSLFGISNRQGVAGSIFGGGNTGSPAIEAMLGGYRYLGRGNGLLTDLDLGSGVPITLGGSSLGSTSARIRGTADLDPALTLDTRLADLGGARGLGVTPGRIEFSFNGGARIPVDLTGADSAQHVANALTAAIRDYEQANSVTILGPGGVSVAGGGFSLDVAAGTLQFHDTGSGITAQDLGLADAAGTLAFTSTSASGLELDPKLTWRTPISALRGVVGGLGQIKVSNLGQSRTIDLSSAQTLGDVRNALQSAGLGLRVELNQAGTGFDVLNEVAAGRNQALSIEEIAGNGLTATRLGIRSFTGLTRIADFNDGRGVQIVDGKTDPVSGLPSAAANADFTITLGDPGSTSFTVDLRPQDMASVQSVIDRINAEAAAAGINVPADFNASLADGANGIALAQNPAWTGSPSIKQENNSPAAEQLGLLAGSFDVTTGVWQGADRATVRVDNLFTHLIDLRDALMSNDTTGITLAGERLESSVKRLAETRALVGGYAKRVIDGTVRQEDLNVLDQKARSQLQDTDFTEAATRFSLLQTQLQAALTVTAQSFSRSLLDFLG
ncbi:MAG: flagellin [Phycisphaerales bacterium]